MLAHAVPGAPEVTARWINQFTSIITSFSETVSIVHGIKRIISYINNNIYLNSGTAFHQ
jgi:hypothetical protein